MIRIFVICFAFFASVSSAQMSGGYAEAWSPYNFDLPTVCQNSVENIAVSGPLKQKMRESGSLASQLVIAYKGRIVMSCGLGYNDPAARQKLTAGQIPGTIVKMEPWVHGRYGSISKFYVRAALQQAKAEGKVNFSDNLATASGITPYNGVVDSSFVGCTVQKAIDHQCQISRQHATQEEVISKTGWKRPLTAAQQNSYELGRVPFNVTGDYSNVGYGLLGSLLERVYQKPLIDIIHEKVTGPIGIANDEVQTVLGGHQFCSDGKWTTKNGVQYCSNIAAVTRGREPGEVWVDSASTMPTSVVPNSNFPSEYDGQLALAGDSGIIENTNGAFSLVGTPRAALKMVFSYNSDGTTRRASDICLGGQSATGEITGGAAAVARNGCYAVYLHFNRLSIDPANGQRIEQSVINSLLEVVNGIDWSMYPDLDADNGSRITMRTYCHTALNYCFLANPGSAAILDTAPGWVRQTGPGDSFTAWSPGVKKNVYRFFYPELFTLATGEKVGSHFFGLYKDAKDVTKYNPQLPLTSSDGWKGFVYEAIEMSVEEPVAGVCPSGTVPVYRLFRAGTPTVSANHRYTTGIQFYQSQVATGDWEGEGVVFCSAQ